MTTSSRPLRPAIQTLEVLQSALGPAADVAYGDSGLRVIYRGSDQMPDLCDRLAALADPLTVRIKVPATTHSGMDDLLLGEISGARFMARTAASDDIGPHLSIHIYAGNDPRDDAALARLDAEHHVMDALFASLGNADQSLTAYISHRLLGADTAAGNAFASELASLLSDYLADQHRDPSLRSPSRFPRKQKTAHHGNTG